MHHIEWISTYQHSREKCHLSQLKGSWTEQCFGIVSRHNILRLWKSFKIARQREKKKFDMFEVFLDDERVRKDENYILFSNSRELVDYTSFPFHLICERVLIFLYVLNFWLRKCIRCSRGLLSVVDLIWRWWVFGLARTTSQILTLRSSWTTHRSFHPFYWKVLNRC